MDNFLGDLRKARLTTIDSGAIVKIGYGLVEAKCSLNALQWTLLFALISAMDSQSKNMNFYKVSAVEVAEILRINGKNRVRVIRDLCGTLLTEKVYLRRVDENGEVIEDEMTWFYRLQTRPNNPYILFKMDDELATFLLNQEINYVQLKLNELLQFRRKYTFQLYALVVKNKKFKHQTFLILDLLEQFGCPETYKAGRLFEERVLIPSFKEINDNTQLKVKWQIKNKARLIIQISIKNKYADFFESLSPIAQEAYNYFKSIKVASHAMVKCVNTFGEKVFVKIYHEILEKNPNDINDMAAYAAACLINGYHASEIIAIPKNKNTKPDLVPEGYEQGLTSEEIEKQKIENENQKQERQKKIHELKRLSDDEQESLYNSVLEFTKKESKIYYSIIKKYNYQSILEDGSVIGIYLNMIQKKAGGV